MIDGLGEIGLLAVQKVFDLDKADGGFLIAIKDLDDLAIDLFIIGSFDLAETKGHDQDAKKDDKKEDHDAMIPSKSDTIELSFGFLLFRLVVVAMMHG